MNRENESILSASRTNPDFIIEIGSGGKASILCQAPPLKLSQIYSFSTGGDGLPVKVSINFRIAGVSTRPFR